MPPANAVFRIIWLLPKLPLWFDEILDLIGARSSDLPSMFRFVRQNAGSVPLAYVLQWASVHTFGVSAFSGRLPSAVASVAGCVGVF